MSKIEKKRKKLQERIEFLEAEMFTNLKQKTSTTPEIKIGYYHDKISDLRKQLSFLQG